MANEQNLKPFTSEQSREEAKINGRKGGIASGEAKRRRKTLKEELEILLEKIEDGQTNQERMSISLFREAIKGNTKAFEIIRDTVGEKPKENISVGVSYEDYIKKVEDKDEY